MNFFFFFNCSRPSVQPELKEKQTKGTALFISPQLLNQVDEICGEGGNYVDQSMPTSPNFISVPRSSAETCPVSDR